MRNTYKLWMVAGMAALSLASCKSKNSGEGSAAPADSVTTGMGKLDSMEAGAAKMEDMQVTLKNVTKLSSEQLKSFFPDSINGWMRSAYSGGSQAFGVQVSSANAVYDAGDRELMLTLTDGAGETGAAIVSLAAMGLTMDLDKETDYDWTKNESVYGLRASTRETKPQQEGNVVDSDITFIYKDRYMIKLEGDGFKLNELKDLVPQLDLKSLQ